MTNISRTLGKHKKRDVSVMAIALNASDLALADTYEVAVLPTNVLIIASSLVTLVPFDGAAPTVAAGFEGGSGSEIIAATPLDSPADTVVPGNGDISVQTGPVVTLAKTGASTTGKAVLTIEYIEYEQCTGELTNFVA